MLVAAAVAAAVSTLLVLVRPPSLRPGPATPRALAALLSLLPLSAGPAVVALAGGTTTTVAVAAAVLVLADVAWLRLTRHWSWRGHAAWAATTTLSAAYLALMLRASVGDGGSPLGLLLWLLELAVLVLGTATLWEVLDVTSRRRWRRRLPEGVVGEPVGTPFVSLHVPAHAEPADMVIDTLTALVALDYPAYEVVMIDDNTVDPALWQPVRDWCAAYDGPVPLRFVHLEDWPGYKSGALNYALQHATDPRAEVIGVVDADYVVQPDYLRRCAPLFAERPRLAFVQTPQDYRDWQHAPYLRRLFTSYEYFFRVSQVSRNEVDGAIFGGTMGLIRRSALEQVGGWDEWCITEDAELSLKLLRAGWSGQHVERAFGHGVMPLTFEALKRQRFRWCFGGVQILRAHWRSLMPWDRSRDNHLTQAQRWAYLFGGLQWFGDVLALLFAGVLVLISLPLLLGTDLALRRLAGPLLVLPPLLLGLVLLRGLAVARLRTGSSWRDAVGALGLWLALGWTVALACVRGLTQPEGVFLRTPKTREEPSLADALRANRVEASAGSVLAAAAVALLVVRPSLASAALAGMLGWHAAGLLAAPLNSLAAARVDLSPQLRRRRASELLRVPAAVRPVRTLTGAVVLSSVATVALALAAPSVAPSLAPLGPRTDVLADLRGEPPGPQTGPVPVRQTRDAERAARGERRPAPPRGPAPSASTPSGAVPGPRVPGGAGAPPAPVLAPPAAGRPSVRPSPATTAAPAPATSPPTRPSAASPTTAPTTATSPPSPSARSTGRPSTAPTRPSPQASPAATAEPAPSRPADRPRPSSSPRGGRPSPTP